MATDTDCWLGRVAELTCYDSRIRSEKSGHDGCQLIAVGESERELWLRFPNPMIMTGSPAVAEINTKAHIPNIRRLSRPFSTASASISIRPTKGHGEKGSSATTDPHPK